MITRRTIEKTGFFFLASTTFFTCVSKGGVNISFGLLALTSLLYCTLYPDGRAFLRNRYVAIFLLPFAVGFVASFFSPVGLQGVAAFLGRYRFFLLVIPCFLFLRTENRRIIVLGVLNVSAAAGLMYRGLQDGFHFYWNYNLGAHVIGRSSDLMLSIVLLNLVWLWWYRSKNGGWNGLGKVLIAIMTLVMTVAVIVMFRRGSYLGLTMGVVLLLIVMRKGWWLVAGTAMFVLALSVSDSRLAERVKSIADTTHTSSSVRIQLAVSGLDFIVDQGLFFRGTGAKMSKESHIAFYQAQPPDYQKRFQLIKKFFGNFHNSFLQMAVEYGLLFLISFLAATVCLLRWMIRRMSELDMRQRVYPVAALVVTGGFFMSQVFHGDLYSYGAIPYILVFSAGCLVVSAGGANGDTGADVL